MKLQIAGRWPDRQTVRRGWSKAHIRPWNDALEDVAVRLERGSHQFLADVSSYAASMVTGEVFSPALHPSAVGVWSRAGYHPHESLLVMELRLPRPVDKPDIEVRVGEARDVVAAAQLDESTFEGFWRIGRIGIEEAIEATSRSVMLVVGGEETVVGYAVVGVQLGHSFLQRIAVHPAHHRTGVGTALLAHAVNWAASHGGGTMMLNVRPDNSQAIGFYRRWGFVTSDKQLQVMKFE